MDELKRIRQAALEDLEQIRDLASHEAQRIRHLGRNSTLSNFLRGLKERTASERKEIGAAANRLRAELEEQFQGAKDRLSETTQSVRSRLDVTAPAPTVLRGHVHPLTQLQEKLNQTCAAMGFQIVEGPEVETDFTNFDALNIPADHPARGMQDTFWVKGGSYLMRTHTSPMQVRFMQTHQPPIRIVVPGRVYRNEATDMTHDFQFHQIEGLMVDRTDEKDAPSLANLKGVLEYLFREFFDDPTLRVRFNASYFPFVEPGVEVFIQGTKGALAGRWIEVAGAGMVHQNVFERVGYVRGEMQGFAFGAALERLAMLKYGIDDIRLFRGGDLRFLKQF